MKKNHSVVLFVLAVVLGLLLVVAPTHAEEKTVKEGAKDAGRAVGTAIREVGQGAKEAGKAIGHAAKEGVEAAKEGGRELKKAVKGEN